MFKMVDRESGRLLALRADITPQIARIVATRLRDEPKPLRLAYVTNVFRYDEPQVGRYREFYQAGVELVGLAQPGGRRRDDRDGHRGAARPRPRATSRSTWARPDFFRGLLEDLGADAGHRARAALGAGAQGRRLARAPWWPSWRRPPR